MEAQPFAAEMQREMMREIERAAPDYLVFVAIPTSWERLSKSDPAIFDWMMNYCAAHMDLDGVIELLPGLVVESQWNVAGRDFTPRTNCWLAISRKKAGPGQVLIQLDKPAF